MGRWQAQILLPPRSRLRRCAQSRPQADACGYMLPPHSGLSLDELHFDNYQYTRSTASRLSSVFSVPLCFKTYPAEHGCLPGFSSECHQFLIDASQDRVPLRQSRVVSPDVQRADFQFDRRRPGQPVSTHQRTTATRIQRRGKKKSRAFCGDTIHGVTIQSTRLHTFIGWDLTGKKFVPASVTHR